jgi:hypothetical protein
MAPPRTPLVLGVAASGERAFFSRIWPCLRGHGAQATRVWPSYHRLTGQLARTVLEMPVDESCPGIQPATACTAGDLLELTKKQRARWDTK